MLSLVCGFKLLQERSMRAELLLSQVQTPGARCACVQQAAILQQQQKQQKHKLPEAPKRKEGSRNTFKNRKFRRIFQLLDLEKAQCSQINHSYYFGTWQALGLAQEGVGSKTF